MNISKRIIGNEDYKTIRKRLNKIKRIHSQYFSKSRLVFWKIVNVLKLIGLALLFFILISATVIVLSILINYFLGKKDDGTLMTISYALFGAAASATFAVPIAIAIGLHSSNEYFNQTESKLFFEMNVFPFFSNSLIAFYSFLYAISGFIFATVSKYTDSILNLTVSLIMSIILFCQFRTYSKKNKTDRFYYYLKHSIYSKKLNKSNVIEDYIVMLDVVGKHTNKGSLQLLSALAVDRIKYLERFQIELRNMIKEEQNVSWEQKIIEDLYIQQSKNLQTPIEFFAFHLSISMYISTLKNNLNPKLTKSFSKTISNMVCCLDYSVDRALTEVSKFIIPVDDLPESVLFYLDFHKTIFTEYAELTYSISSFLSTLSLFFKEIQQEAEQLDEDYKDKVEIINGKINELKQRINTNIDSESVLVKKIEKNVIGLQEKIKQISEKNV